MYFDDLTPYAYFPLTLTATVRNVGWLDAGHDFATGSGGGQIADLLERRFSQLQMNQTRGSHDCPFCGADLLMDCLDGKSRWIGSCELWVPAVDGGSVYAAPGLILHYLREHQYLPPDEFVAAVLALDSRGTAWNPASVVVDNGLVAPRRHE